MHGSNSLSRRLNRQDIRGHLPAKSINANSSLNNALHSNPRKRDPTRTTQGTSSGNPTKSANHNP